jgi:hypothetical protein
VERAAEALGAEIGADERTCVEGSGEVAPTMYLGMDGTTGVPMRTSEVAGHAGKQSDGSAKTREAELVTIWSAESREDQGKPMRDPGPVTYSAAIESAAATSPPKSGVHAASTLRPERRAAPWCNQCRLNTRQRVSRPDSVSRLLLYKNTTSSVNKFQPPQSGHR